MFAATTGYASLLSGGLLASKSGALKVLGAYSLAGAASYHAAGSLLTADFDAEDKDQCGNPLYKGDSQCRARDALYGWTLHLGCGGVLLLASRVGSRPQLPPTSALLQAALAGGLVLVAYAALVAHTSDESQVRSEHFQYARDAQRRGRHELSLLQTRRAQRRRAFALLAPLTLAGTALATTVILVMRYSI